MFKKLTLFVALFGAGCLPASDNVLLWCFDDPVIRDFDGTEYHAANLPGRGEAEGLTPNLVRVSATDKDGNVVYLNLGETQEVCDLPGLMVPTYTVPPVWKAGPAYADISSVVQGAKWTDTSITFALELGHAIVHDDGTWDWIVMASTSETLRDLVDGGHIRSSELSVQGDVAWSPGMSVPEPSSGLLMLVGGALLALRRRRKGAKA